MGTNYIWVRISANSCYEFQKKMTALRVALKSNTALDTFQNKTDNNRYRFSYLASSKTDILRHLDNYLLAHPKPVSSKPMPITWLFTGQGSQRSFMGYELDNTQTVYRNTLDECESILSVREHIYSDCSQTLDQTLVTQPSLFAHEVSLAKLWESFGIKPNTVMGHSVGEIAAAAYAKVFSIQDGMQLISKRAKGMHGITTSGSMAALLQNREQVVSFINEHQLDVQIAAFNGPCQTIISGASDAVTMAVTLAKSNKIRAKKLVVSQAFHSTLMQPMLEPFKQSIADIEYNTPDCQIISNVSASEINSFNADYWVKHIISPVDFAGSINHLSQDKRIYIEIGPSSVLINMAQKIIAGEGNVYLASISKDEQEMVTMVKNACILDQLGHDIHWSNIDSLLEIPLDEQVAI